MPDSTRDMKMKKSWMAKENLKGNFYVTCFHITKQEK